MGESDARFTRDLLAEGPTLQLGHDLVNLAKTRGPDRLPIRDTTTIGIDRQPTTGEVVADEVAGALIPCSAKAGLGKVHDLGAALGILYLGNLDILGLHACCPERRRSRVNRWARSNPG